MAGRGRGGRGRGGSSNFKPEVFGLSKEDMKSVCEGPPPIFPTLINKPLPNIDDEKHKYFITVRQEFRNLWITSPYNIQYDTVKKDIERYRDRFEKSTTPNTVDHEEWKPDPACFPKELLEVAKKRTHVKKSNSKKKLKLTKDLGKTLENLEMKEKEDDDDDDEAKTDDSDEEDEINEPKDDDTVEEELEEGTDYGMSYFDNGENYIEDEEDNLDDGPIF